MNNRYKVTSSWYSHLNGLFSDIDDDFVANYVLPLATNKVI